MRNIATTFSYINVSRWNIQQMEMFQTMQTRSEIGLPNIRGELSYLAPLGSENISAPYFKQCFFGGGGITPPDWVKHHASQSQERNNKYFILYIEFCTNNKI